MNQITKVIQLLWKGIELTDNARLAKQTPAEGLTQINNIPYCENDNPLNTLDIYYPENTVESDKLPVVIDVHGGGWYYGTKELNKNYCLDMAKRGFIVFNMSYRLVPQVTMDCQLRDVVQALKWINEHLKDYPCDENAILLTGDSAGGQLASFAAALCVSPKLREAYSTVDPGIKFSALSVISPVAYLTPGRDIMGINFRTILGKGYADKPFADYLDIDKLLDEVKLPPTFLATSSGDAIARSATIRMYRDIEARGGTAYIMDWKKSRGMNLPHVFSVVQPGYPESIKTTDEMLAFFLRHAKKEAESAAIN